VGRLFAPFLEQSLALTPAVGAPQVATTGAVVATVVGAVVAVAATSHARSSVKVDQRGTPAKIIKNLPENALNLMPRGVIRGRSTEIHT
jgi:hypothetical protein